MVTFFSISWFELKIFHEVLYVTLGIISKKKKNIPTSPSHFTRYVLPINCTRPPRHWVASQSGVAAPTPWRLASGISGLLLSQRVRSPTSCSWCVWSKNVYRPRGTLATWKCFLLRPRKWSWIITMRIKLCESCSFLQYQGLEAFFLFCFGWGLEAGA